MTRLASRPVVNVSRRAGTGLRTDAGVSGDSAPDPAGGWSFQGIWNTGGSVEQRRQLRRRRRFGVVMSAVWLVYLAYPVVDAFGRSGRVRVLALSDLCVFAGVYVVALTFAWRRSVPRALRTFLFCLEVSLAVVAVVLLGDTGMTAGVYLVSAGATLFRGRAGLVWSSIVLVVAAASMVFVPELRDFGTGFAYVFVFVIMRVVATNIRRGVELTEANEEIARLAVSEERLRFSRDLHDILGHSLTAISLKAGLANRLLPDDPARAAAEMADVERLAREALADVRATVAGYRGITLVGELARARQTLDDAGILADLPQAVDTVPGDRRELFGWIVREGVTNVVRHSSARHCRIEVAADRVEIDDDGRGCPQAAADAAPADPARAVGGGAGLAGLRERVAVVGGRLEAGPVATGGYRLRVVLPG